jgi:dTDP-4-amino-4,6-dideoxygalactose transaminase
VIRTNDRENMMKHLKDAGIGSAIHYPVPLHMQRAYVSLNYSTGDFPVTESVTAEIVSLPIYPQLATAQQEQVAEAVIAFSTQMRDGADAALRTLVTAEPIA